LGGGSSTGAIDGGGRPFREGNREPWVGFEGERGGGRFSERRGRPRGRSASKPAVVASWLSGRRRKTKGGGARA
jgi:hypothetical protein